MSASWQNAGLGCLQRRMIRKSWKEAGGDPAKLPWHREDPSPLLVKLATSRPAGRALDIGCGSGIFSRYLVSVGYDVVAVDLFPEAATMARRLSDGGPRFEVIEADILKFEPAHVFDLVYDSGCLHNFSWQGVRRYAARLASWLAPNGDFALEHWSKRHAFDWRPFGPYRRSQRTIAAAFEPRFKICRTLQETFDVPWPLGPKVLGISYHFKHA